MKELIIGLVMVLLLLAVFPLLTQKGVEQEARELEILIREDSPKVNYGIVCGYNSDTGKLARELGHCG